MKRLTEYICGYAHGAKGINENKLTGIYCRGEFEATALVERLAKIEDILGDDYDLDKLRESIEKQAEYEEFMNRWKNAVALAGAVKEIGSERVAELVEADKDGRCVIKPCNIGDTIYIITQEFNGSNTEFKIEKRTVDGYAGNALNPIWIISKEPYELHFFPSEFGRTVFLTYEEAKAALNKIKHN